MERRGEPRFPVTSPIRVIVPGEAARMVDSTLINISATGVRFLTDEDIATEEVVAIEVDSRLILAEVRYCQPRGERFVVGARRLHEIAKDERLTDAPAVVSEILGHLHRHIAAGEETQTLAAKALEQIVERRELPQIEPVPEQLPDPILAPAAEQPVADLTQPPEPEFQFAEPPVIELAPAIEAESHAQPEPPAEPAPPRVDLTSVDLPSPDLASVDLPSPDLASPDLASVDLPSPDLASVELPSPDLPSPDLPSPDLPSPDLATVRPPSLDPSSFEPPIPRGPRFDPLEAARLALSANAVVERPVAPGPSDEKKWRLLFGLAAALVLALVVMMFFIQRRTEAKPAPATPAASTSTTATVLPAKSAVHHVVIRVLHPVWMSIASDGQDPFKSPFNKDETHRFDFSTQAVVRVSDAASVEITIDTNPVGPFRPGQQILQLTPTGVELVQ